ncbi:MAG: iron ABC transporter permease, partial [Chloroflexota bacterium]
VSAGSSATIAVITIFALPVPFVAIPLLALAGGVTAGAVVVLTMSRVGDPIRLILMGISVNALLYALIITVTSLGDQNSVGLLYLYLLGSIANRTWDYVNIILPWAVIAIPAALLMARPLNLLQLGDEVAEGMGLRVTRIRLLIALIAAGLVAGVVAVCGPIAFVALVAPHITRRALNTTDARVVLPLSALAGATLLLGADVLAKNLFDPMELPVGIWTTVLGGPLLLLMLRRQLGADNRQGGSRA